MNFLPVYSKSKMCKSFKMMSSNRKWCHQMLQNDVIKCCKMMSSNVALLHSNNCCVLEPAICEDLDLHIVIFVLSVVCTLKGVCQDGQYKGSKQCYCVLCMLCCLSILSTWRSKHVMHWIVYAMLFVDTVSIKTLVFVALIQHYIHVWKLCIKWPLTPPRGKDSVLCLPSCGFSCSPVRGGSFFNFHGLVNYKGDFRQDAQPVPNS